MTIAREYRAILFDDEQTIDETVIDENSEELAWYLFKEEFGHTNLNDSAYIVIEPLGLYDVETGNDVEETPENLASVEE